MNENPKIQIESPAADEPEMRVKNAETVAAGLPAIVSTFLSSFKEMGAARTLRTLKAVNQKGGFDCQSCAWADPDDDRHLFEFCENGAKAIADEATKSKVNPQFFQKYSVAELSEKSDFWLNQQGRITTPMFLPHGATHYQPITWDKALDVIAAELNSLASPDEAVFYTSGRTSNEAAFLYQLFVRQFGTNNLPDCSNMCHESSGAALGDTIGIGKGTVTLEDFEKTDLIFIIGQNPGTNHPRMLTALERAKSNGAKIVAVNPLREAGLLNVVNPNPQEYKNPLLFPFKLAAHAGTPLADLHLPIKIGGDLAFLQGLMKILFDAENKNPGTVFDHEFINQKTAGFAEFKANLEKVSWQDIETQSGLSGEQISEAAEFYLHAKTVITCWAMGLTQHKHSVGTICEIVNLHLLRGQIGKSGAGLCPVRGHSNVQGDRTMGIWEKPQAEFLDALDKEFNFKSPREYGLDTVDSIRAMRAGRIKFFMAMGGSFLSATPDTNATAAGLRNCRLTVQIITKLNRSALITGANALILPPLGRTEKDFHNGTNQFVTTENSMGVVQPSKGILTPASKDLRSEPWIAAQLAKRVLGAKTTVDWDILSVDYDEIRNKIEKVVPGFENYNERVKNGEGFYLPNLPRTGEFPTKNGKANFTVNSFPLFELKNGELIMMTIRSHDQFNTTIYGLDDRYRGIKNGRRVVFLNETDIAALNVTNGQIVDLHSDFNGERRTARNFAVVPYDIPKGCAATYFPETNVLVALDSVAERSNTPTSKFVVITIEPRRDV